jgi:fructose-1-phosphate kinase PfkB-like protein
MLIINSVEKARLSADSFSYSGSGVAWKARVVLFLGFAALAGGLAGGVTGEMRSSYSSSVEAC